MGCEVESLPEKQEKDHSSIQNPCVSERSIESRHLHSISCFNSLKSESNLCDKKTHKMTSVNNLSGCSRREGVREPVESVDETTHHLDETSETAEADVNENVPVESEEMNNGDNGGTNVLCNDGANIENNGRTNVLCNDGANVENNGGTNVLCNDGANIENNGDEGEAEAPMEGCSDIKSINATEEPSANDKNEMKNTEIKLGSSAAVEIGLGTSADSPSSGTLSDQNLQLQILLKLEKLKDRLETCTDIPEILFDVSLNCLKPSTIEYLSYHLDPEMEVLSSDNKCKDYRGMAEWIGLENIFIKYISRSSFMVKTQEVLSKWLTQEVEPLPNVKNLRECLLAIERPDVLEDLSIKIARDAVAWKMTQFEAQSAKKSPRNVDTSWQLTRHDVVSGKKTMYTACLLYADEDELMAQIITKLYKTAYKQALFFLPQFDLKHGKYELDTTARVIDERCDKKVIFLLSEYFYASHICQFAVNYAAAHGTGHGNLIPFHLTRNVTAVPNVLKGIAGIRWFRKGTRHHTWQVLADSLLAEKLQNQELLADIKERIGKMVEKEREYYLQDPPYDDDVAPPGEPIEVIEPEGPTNMPTLDLEFQRIKLEDEMQRKKQLEKKSRWKIMKQVTRAILEKILPGSLNHYHSKSQSSPSSHQMTEMETINISKTQTKGVVTKSDISSNSPTSSVIYKRENVDDSELGAVGGENIRQECNDLNVDTEFQNTNDLKVTLNISKSESMLIKTKEDSLGENHGMACSQQRLDENNDIFSDSMLVSDTGPKPNSKSYTKINCTGKKAKCLRHTTSTNDVKTISDEKAEPESESLIIKERDLNKNRFEKSDEVGRYSCETDALIADYNRN